MSHSVLASRRDTSGSTSYAILMFEDLHLVVPQGDVRTLEPISAVAPPEQDDATVGSIAFQGDAWPVYCLASDLQPLRTLPATRRVCALLDTGDRYFGLTCDQIRTLTNSAPRLLSIPPCMHTRDSPIQALALYEKGGLGCVTSAVQLADFLSPTDGRSGQLREVRL